MSATLNKLTTLGKQLSVTNDIISGRSRWWFLVRGKEEVLEGELKSIIVNQLEA